MKTSPLTLNRDTPNQDVFYDRMCELVDDGTLSCCFEPDEIDVRMGWDFMYRFIKESLGANDIRATKRGYSRYCLTGNRKGYLDFRFKLDKRLPTNSFVIRVKD